MYVENNLSTLTVTAEIRRRSAELIVKNVQKRLDKITKDRHRLEYLISQRQEPIILQIKSTFLEENIYIQDRYQTIHN